MKDTIKTALLVADGFEEIEGLTVVDLLRRAGIVCDMVSPADRETVTGSHWIRIGTDRLFSGTSFVDYTALILPGGLKGTQALREDERVIRLVREFHAAGKLLAAICAAPTVLSDAGLLKGRKATCHPGSELQLTSAEFCAEPVVQDGNLITSRGAGTAMEFALAIIAELDSQETAQEIAEKIVYAR